MPSKNKHNFLGAGYVLATLLVVALSLLILPKASAQTPDLALTSSCTTDQTSYSALSQAPADTYDIFVRLGKRDQTADVNLYFQSFSSATCQSLGQIHASGNAWTKLGVIGITEQDTTGTFTLVSATLQGLPNANRPSIMLVSQTHAVCQPTDECRVKIDNREALLRAGPMTSSTDSLHVVTIKDPSTDTVQQVNYFIDNKPAYSSAKLEPFDLRYVSSGKHNLATVITYDSEQQAVIPEHVDQGAVDDLNHLIFTYLTSKKLLWLIVGSIILTVILFDVFLAVARHIHAQRLWKSTHILEASVNSQQNATTKDSPKFQLRFFRVDLGAGHIAKRLAQVLAGLSILVILWSVGTRWCLRFYTVDGVSMQSSYKSGDLVLINKFAKTFSEIIGKKYTPKRGEIVVFRKERNVLFEPVESAQPTYLIKRIIGLPGERVVISQEQIKIINTAHPEGFNPDQNQPWSKDIHTSDLDDVDVTLGADEVFVCGDNRPDSVDSRSYGPVKLRELVGSKLFVIK